MTMTNPSISIKYIIIPETLFISCVLINSSDDVLRLKRYVNISVFNRDNVVNFSNAGVSWFFDILSKYDDIRATIQANNIVNTKKGPNVTKRDRILLDSVFFDFTSLETIFDANNMEPVRRNEYPKIIPKV